MSRILSYVEKPKSQNLISEGLIALEAPGLSRLCKACIRWWMAHSWFWLERYEECRRYLLEYLSEYEYYCEHPIELENDRMSIGVSSCYERVRIEESYEILICSKLKCGDEDGFEKYIGKLDFSVQSSFYEKEFFGCIRDAIPKYQKSQRLEDLIIKVRQNPDAWRRFCESLTGWIMNEDERLNAVCKLCQQADDKANEFKTQGESGQDRKCAECLNKFIQYKQAAQILIKGQNLQSYEEIKDIFMQFMVGVLGHCDTIYGEAFRDNEELDRDALVGLILEQAFLAENDENTFIAGLKQVSAVEENYAKAVNQMIILYRAKKEKQIQARDELLMLRTQVLEQAETLIAAKQGAAAASVLDQLLAIFPSDGEIIKLREKIL